LRSQWIALK